MRSTQTQSLLTQTIITRLDKGPKRTAHFFSILGAYGNDSTFAVAVCAYAWVEWDTRSAALRV